MDQGGELFRNPKVVRLFEEFGYDVFPTGADSSHQNGPVERSHQTIGNALRTILTGADLDARFWPYAFQHYLRIKNALPGRDSGSSPTELLTGVKPNFKALRTFGCRVWVRPPGPRPNKLVNNAHKGIFLGFAPHTMKNIYWYDPSTSRVKLSYHARFDEGMYDLPQSHIPPHVQHLQRLLSNDEKIPVDHTAMAAIPFDTCLSPFTQERDVKVKVKCSNKSFGFGFENDDLLHRAFILELLPGSSAETMCSSPRATRRKYLGAFVTAVGDTPVFSKRDVLLALTRLFSDNVSTFVITLAPERLPTASELSKLHKDQHSHMVSSDDPPSACDTSALHLSVDILRSITSIRSDDPDLFDDCSPHDISRIVSALHSNTIPDEERNLGRFTRRKLKQLSTWPEWKAAEQKQLTQFWNLGMFGPPCRPPKNAILLRSIWDYKNKSNGTKRARFCCDGSPRAAPRLHAVASTFASCAEHPVFRLFIALSAAENWQIFGGDARDAFAHSPGPSVSTFIIADEAFVEWWLDTRGDQLPLSTVLPIQRALQGHPEAPKLWETYINRILDDSELGFKSTTHDKNIYHAVVRGERVLMCRQVDDFALATASPAIAAHIYDRIGLKLQLPCESTPPFEHLGLVTMFNGVDVDQTRDHIRLHCSTYLHRVLKAHAWDTPSATPLTPREPMNPSTIHEVYESKGPSDKSSAHSALETKMGFRYRALLGELLYAYVICRLDVGYAITTLAKFAHAPARIHYQALKHLALYLKSTIDWGIIYWRSSLNFAFPHKSWDLPFISDDLPTFPCSSLPFQLVGYLDAAHANDLRNRRSTTGYGFMIAGGAVAYRSTTQTVTATSSTEAEFYSAVTAAKVARYLRFILHELGYAQDGPTLLYCDNESAINIINNARPTNRARHIEVQYFAVQDWRAAGDITMQHIPGIINASDCLTKPVGWILHARHARRLMGHFGSSF